MSDYRRKGLLFDAIYAEPQAPTHLQCRSAANGGIVAATSEAHKSANCAHSGHVSFDGHVFKLTTLTVESFWHLGCNGEELLEQVVTIVVGGEQGGGKVRKGALMEQIK